MMSSIHMEKTSQKISFEEKGEEKTELNSDTPTTLFIVRDFVVYLGFVEVLV